MATKFRCYLLRNGHIAGVQVVECEDDAAAVLEAGSILEASDYLSAEVWDRERQVSIISRKRSAA
jgi:hypothetical protein